MSITTCHVCGHPQLHEVEAYARFPRITSDFRPWAAGGRLGVCPACGVVQKLVTDDWRRECREIYAAYVVYPQGSGSEQAVFASSGAGEARSRLILRQLIDGFSLPADGRHLDFGCGDGSLLRNAAALLPRWRRAGAELNESRRPEIEAIPGVQDFYAGAPEAIPACFDLVTAVHVLEHFVRPAEAAAMLGGKLVPTGLLMIQTPDLRNNPFDLLIVDHATHFTPPHLAACLADAGLGTVRVADDWVQREISVVARAGTPVQPAMPFSPQDMISLAESHLDWLDRLCTAARCSASGAKHAGFGLFGTSIAATWLFSQISDVVAFFVDEDPARHGSTYLGRPVLRPADVPCGACVFIAHTPQFAVGIIDRLALVGTFEVAPPPPLVRA